MLEFKIPMGARTQRNAQPVGAVVEQLNHPRLLKAKDFVVYFNYIRVLLI